MSINSLDDLEQCIDTNNEINITTIEFDNDTPLGFNIAKILEEHLEKFVNLEIFKFQGDNDVVSLDTFLVKLFSLKKLEKLTIRYVGLTTLPKEIGNLVNLKILILDNNNLTSLPEEMDKLVNLGILNLDNNGLTTLPNVIFNLKNLTYLDLGYNKLTTLPEEIGKLVSLKLLNLENNGLTTLPNAIGKLINLNFLALDYNKLTTLPKKIGDLVKLTHLNLNNNKLTTLPNEIGNLVNLTDLALNNNELTTNELTTLPNEIGNLVKLTDLLLSNNKLTTLPNKIGDLVKLTRLSLNNNKLTTLPNEIGNLVNLKDLALNNNELETLPEEMLSFTNLQRIDVLNNIFNDRAIQIIQTIQPRDREVNNQGIAFEVHNEFKKIFGNRENSFIVLLNSMIKSSSPTKTTFADIKPIVQSFVSSPENLDSSPKKLVKLNQVLERFGNSSESKNPKTIEIIAKTIQYVNEQPIEFKHLYSDIFIQDCFHAYNGDGNTLSCVKGIIEKFVLSLHQTLIGSCPDDASCKVNYKTLLDFFNNNKKVDLNEIARQWSELPLSERKGTNPEKTITIFKKFIKTKYIELNLNIDIEEQKKINEYIKSIDYVFVSDNDNLEFGGSRRKRKTFKRGRKRKTKRERKMKNGGKTIKRKQKFSIKKLKKLY
jgi:Leucine-rich repeat (LRR) protein